MKAYTTEEINEKINDCIERQWATIELDYKRLKQWMIDNGNREEDKPLNRWYRYNLYPKAIFFIGENGECFGVNVRGEWTTFKKCDISLIDYELCPEEEWKAMLINEAKKRDYSKGNYTSTIGSEGIVSKAYYIGKYGVYHGEETGKDREVFDIETGQWAEIIPEVPEYTMTEAIEKMGHKFKIKE